MINERRTESAGSSRSNSSGFCFMSPNLSWREPQGLRWTKSRRRGGRGPLTV